ncbi:MAG: folate family ECF transporter S component [Clostridia bacterium]|nr:folate family ECF transporter S component [Clostridia bacterium]
MERKRSVNVRKLVLCALLAAMQIVLARFAGVQVNEGIRISFEAVPLILAGFWLGPVWGMASAIVADLLGTVISGYGVYFPLLTGGPVLLTVVAGLGGNLHRTKDGTSPRGILMFVLTVFVAELVSTFAYTPWALTLYYSIVVGKEMPYWVLFTARLPGKLVTLPVDILLSWVLHRSLYRPVIAKMTDR